jgi:hypothetical protein
LPAAQAQSADEGVTIRQVVESALRVYLGKQTRRKGYQLKWKTERAEYYPAFGSTTATPFLI